MGKGNFLQQGMRKAGDIVGAVDDKVQGAIRYALGERDGRFEGDGPLKTAGAFLGTAVHGSRHDLADTWEKPVYLIGTRALQAGGITAAGAGLIHLMNSYGNQADQQSPGELDLDAGDMTGAALAGSGGGAAALAAAMMLMDDSDKRMEEDFDMIRDNVANLDDYRPRR